MKIRQTFTLQAGPADLHAIWVMLETQVQMARINDALRQFYEIAGKRRGDALVRRVIAQATR